MTATLATAVDAALKNLTGMTTSQAIQTQSAVPTTPELTPMRPQGTPTDLGHKLSSMRQRLSQRDSRAWRKTVLMLDEEHEGVTALARWAECFAKWCALGDRRNGHQLVIHGPAGTGKSHAVRRVAAYIRDNAIDLALMNRSASMPVVYMRDWATLMALNDEDQFAAATADIADATLVVIDDIGAETDRYKTGLPADRLRRVLEACRNKWLLLTTNVSRPDWVAVFDARVEDRLRAARHCNTEPIRSYRPKLAAKMRGVLP